MKFKRYLITLVLISAMFFVAEFFNQKEIIFPEILALSTGAWIANKQPWMTNKRKIFLLFLLCSLMGICTVRYIQAPLIVQVSICFFFTGLVLTLTKTSLIPIISACILPVYFQTTTWIYPISVTTMAAIIIAVQWWFEKSRLRPQNHYIPCDFDLKKEFFKWLKMWAILATIALIPFSSHHFYFVAPPLIVTFVEFSNTKSKLRKKPLKVFFVLTGAAFIGMLLRLFLNLFLHLPLTICAILACIFLFIIFEKRQLLFPPAGAILLLPMILNVNNLYFYPIEVAFGSIIFISLGILAFKAKSSLEMQ